MEKENKKRTTKERKIEKIGLATLSTHSQYTLTRGTCRYPQPFLEKLLDAHGALNKSIIYPLIE